jgi:hypothetical protein
MCYVAAMKKLAIAFALIAAVGCTGKKADGWGAKAKAMADDVCKCADKDCGNDKFKKFVKDMTADKDNVSNDDLTDIGDAEHRAEACIDKAK